MEKLNGFNNGRDTLDGIGGNPGLFEDKIIDNILHDPNFYKEMMNQVKKENFALGLPICYIDDLKRLVYEFEDGRIEIIKQLWKP